MRCVPVLLICWSVAASAAPQRHRVVRADEPRRSDDARVNLDLRPAPPPAVIEPTRAMPTPGVREDRGRERHWGLLGGGLALFAAGYALDIGLSYGLGHDPAATSLIPLVGPLVQMGDSWAMVQPSTTGNPMIDVPANQRISEVNNTIQQAAYAVLAVDFVLQLAGTTMVIVGAVGKSRTLERNVAWSITPTGNGMLVKF
ncbi:MAG: hypothetical protein JWN44_2783 [Myxococcales bacterium]|nr:hypothetical protein [Myxococcales bacterium]